MGVLVAVHAAIHDRRRFQVHPVNVDILCRHLTSCLRQRANLDFFGQRRGFRKVFFGSAASKDRTKHGKAEVCVLFIDQSVRKQMAVLSLLYQHIPCS